jgi:putative copper export protein
MFIVDIVVLVLHVLGAAVWTGGHLVLSISVLPRALATRSPDVVLDFESAFERVGIPALGVQVATGIWLLFRLMELGLEGAALTHTTGLTIAKFVLLALTVALAAHARLRLIPRLTADNLRALAWHIVAVTFLSVLFVIAGVGFRVGPA